MPLLAAVPDSAVAERHVEDVGIRQAQLAAPREHDLLGDPELRRAIQVAVEDAARLAQ
jgi:hypothetical protein